MVVEILEEFDVLSRGKHLQIETKLRTETQNLEKANQFLTAILDNIPHMIFVKEAKELRFIRFNKAGENLVGYSHEELEGKNDYDFFPEEQANFFIAKDRDVLQNKTLVDIKEEPIQTKNHGERWLHTKKIPLLAEDGTPRFLLGISEDITEFKKQEDAIRELNKEIESFSYSVSHDLRAPLRAIHGYAKILEEDFEDKLDQEAKRLLEVIRHNAQRMGTLIDDLLSLSRLGRKEISLSSLDMNELVEGAVREINRSHPHTAHITYGTLLPVQGDYGLIHLVVFNLLSNALKYSSKTAQPLIHIESHKTATEIVYSIRDNGVGFNMKYVDKLFGVFQRLHAADEFDGTGVGLAVVKRIVTRHGGHVAATGKVNEGATFQFSLPAS
jgi:PAS domain S-box-containing protein